MKLRRYNSSIIACFSYKELILLFEENKKQLLLQIMRDRGVNMESLLANKTLMEEIAEEATQRLLGDTDQTELFFAIFSLCHFYDINKTEICYELKRSFNPRRNHIATFDDLLSYLEKNTITDCIISTPEGYRFFQLKDYVGPFETEKLFKYISKKIDSYGSMGKTNMLINLRPLTLMTDPMQIDFHKLHGLLKETGLQTQADVLIHYNNMDESNILISVYPDLNKSEIDNPIV